MPVMRDTEVRSSPRLKKRTLEKEQFTMKQSPLSMEISSAPKIKRSPLSQPPSWGRHNSVDTLNVLECLALAILCPAIAIVFWAACNNHGGSLLLLLKNIAEKGFQSLPSLLPRPTKAGFLLYFGWVLFQAILYALLPGKICQGQTTPAGYLLSYKTNGLRAWVVSHLAFYYGAVKYGLFPATIIYDNWDGLLVATHAYGYLLAALVYAKAHLAPSHPEDRKFSGSRLYDFWMGIEFNPRLGGLWDFKLFHNGRPGIIGWTLINASFAAAQLAKYQTITNSMVLVNIFHALYVLDFFAHEDWYLRTIDIAHDHFGLMLAFGDSVWLPFMYTLQARYLVENPVVLSQPAFSSIIALGLAGYIIFRMANNQKDLVRKTKGNCTVWGRPAKFIRASYRSADGKPHESFLLTSGFWGLARHFNYVGDLMLSSAMCLACGFGHVLPYFYFVYMTILLLHRVHRDQERCSVKYGKCWEEYCKRVPYKLIPYLF